MSGGERYVITFDGGALGNPGKGYGSYAIDGPGLSGEPVRLDFSPSGELVTNNQAEYRTLIEALTRLAERTGDRAGRSQVVIQGDSKLVIEQLGLRWKVKHPELIPLHRQALNLLRRFGSHQLVWHGRSNSVRRLGH